MDTLTPKPPFNPARKNQAVKFTPKYVNIMKTQSFKLK